MLKKWLRKLNRTCVGQAPDNDDLFSHPAIAQDTPLEALRFIVLDFETTGLNIRKDKPLSLGAIAVEKLKIQFNQQFECLFYQKAKPGEATLVHGLTPSDIEKGENTADCLKKFYRYAGNAILIAFHAPFDQQILNRASQQNLQRSPDYQFLDLADIAPAYLTKYTNIKGLDNWCEALKIDNDFERHHPAADALATAELLLIALKQAIKQGDWTLAQLQHRITCYKKLKKHQSFI